MRLRLAALVLATSPANSLVARSFVRMASSSFRNPHNLPVKMCVVCQRPFTWRKKWEKDWDEITTCSKRCNSERKAANKAALQLEHGAGWREARDAEASASSHSDADDRAVDDGKAARKAAKKAAKALRRAKREGTARMMDATVGQKPCDLCSRSVDTLVRCQLSTSKEWSMVCGRCWKTPAVAGGVVDGDGSNPNYRYGGLWKNLA